MELRHRLEPHSGKPVVLVFERVGVKPESNHLDYHLDMYFTVIHDDSVLLADSLWGERLVQLQMNRRSDKTVDTEPHTFDGVIKPTSVTNWCVTI